MTGRAPGTVAHEVTEAFQTVLASAIALVVLVVAAFSWFAIAGEPEVNRADLAINLVQDANASLLEEQSALRSYVLSGDAAQLSTYQSLQRKIAATLDQLRGDAGGATSLVADYGRAVAGWQNGWAATALQPPARIALLSSTGSLRAGAVSRFERQGARAFAAIETAGTQVLAAERVAQQHARRLEVMVGVATAALSLAIACAATLSTMRRRRRLYTRVVGPIAVLLAKVRAVGRGEFGASPMIDAPAELMELRDELADMTASLKLQQQALAARAEESAAAAQRMTLVVDFARVVAGSLTVDHALAALTTVARRLTESPRARVWLFDSDAQRLRLTHDSITGDAVPARVSDVGEGGVGRAAKNRRICYAAGLAGEDDAPRGAGVRTVAVPMIKSTGLVGVLEIVLSNAVRLDDHVIDILAATAGHAATAIDAAMLYSRSESLSRSDALTGLANRRRLDEDLEAEVVRAARYRRPLTFLMLDVDHFKAVNDRCGHARGDAVLVEVATLLREQARTGDSVYRYGGEEFAVLARETDEVGGHTVAERLRRIVEDHYPGTGGEVAVTISVGVASWSPRMASAADLIAAADRAMYDAKRAGRNRVVMAGTADGEADVPAGDVPAYS